MKSRIIGCILVTVVLFVLYVMLQGADEANAKRPAQPTYQSPNDAGFKSLKIQ